MKKWLSTKFFGQPPTKPNEVTQQDSIAEDKSNDSTGIQSRASNTRDCVRILCDKETQTEPQVFEEPDFAYSPLPPASKSVERVPYIKYHSHSVQRLQRIKTYRVSIADSEEDEEDKTIHQYTLKHPTTSLQNLTLNKQRSQEDLELKAEIILNKTLVDNFPILMMNKSVTAADLGYREVHNKQTHLRCIKLWLDRKIPESEMSRHDYIHKMIDGCPVDKVVGNGHLLGAEEAWLESCRKKRQFGVIKTKAKENIDIEYRFIMTQYLPTDIKAGESIGQLNNHCVLGTIGYILTQKSNTGILTAGQVAGSIGTRLVSPAKREGKEKEVKNVAVTTTIIISEEVDCAFARILGPVNTLTSSIDDECCITGIGKAQVGDLVKFKGAGTGHIQLAYVKRIDWEGEIDGIMWKNQIQLSIPTLPGDAGAVLVKVSTNQVVGMLFANAHKSALANHIEPVLYSLNANIIIRQF